MVYYLFEEWGQRRDLLRALGLSQETVDRRRDMLQPEEPAGVARGEERAAEIMAFVAGMGGEMHRG